MAVLPHRKAILTAGDFTNLDFLVEVRMLRRPVITHSSVGDIGAVNSLTKLEELDVWVLGTQPRGEVDLQNLPALRRLAFDETLPIRASVAPSLEDLTVEGLDSYWAGNLPMMSGRRKLQLNRPRTLPATLPPSIRTLDLACPRQWDPTFSLSGGTAIELLSHRHPRDA